MTPEFREHEWEPLYTIEHTENNVPVLLPNISYAGIDRCKHCRIIRLSNPTLDTWYMKPNWDRSGEEPHCTVKEDD